MVVLLEPFLSDIVKPDRWGNTSFHLAAAACDYEVVKFLARRSNLDIGLVGHGREGGLHPFLACLESCHP